MLRFFDQYHNEVIITIAFIVIIVIIYYVLKERRRMQHIASLENVVSGAKKQRKETLDDLHAVIDLSEKTIDGLKEIRTKLIAKDK